MYHFLATARRLVPFRGLWVVPWSQAQTDRRKALGASADPGSWLCSLLLSFPAGPSPAPTSVRRPGWLTRRCRLAPRLVGPHRPPPTLSRHLAAHSATPAPPRQFAPPRPYRRAPPLRLLPRRLRPWALLPSPSWPACPGLCPFSRGSLLSRLRWSAAVTRSCRVSLPNILW